MKRNFATKRDALAYEDAFVTGNLSIEEEILQHVYDHYMEEVSEKFKPSTVNCKKNIFETKILPFFGHKKIKDITPAMIREWQKTLEDDPTGLSKTYLNAINRQLNALMNHATRYYNLPKNPCEHVAKMGSCSHAEVEFWTPEEYKAFRNATKNEPNAFVCFETLYWTGIRAGEMLALTESDINLEKNELSINKTYQRLSGSEYITTPKTENSVRRVMLPPFLTEEIDIYMTYGDQPPDRYGRIFPFDDAWLCYRIHKYAKMAGVREIRVHSLRHSAASLLINEGFDALEVSRRLGHKKVSTTLDTYSHLFPTKQDALVARLHELGKD